MKLPALIAVLLATAFSSTQADNLDLHNKYKTIHEKHVLPQVKNIIEITNDQAGWDTGLVYNHGFTWEQAKTILALTTKKVSSCWKSEFLKNANAKEISYAIKAYETGKNQFLSKKVPPYKNAMTKCTTKTGVYLKESMAYIVDNY
jgi:hypothetical protein